MTTLNNLTRTRLAVLLFVSALPGCDGADNGPVRKPEELSEAVQAVVERVHAAGRVTLEDVEELEGIESEIDRAQDLAAANDPAAYNLVHCQVADIKLAGAELAFSLVKTWSLLNYSQTGHPVHNTAHLLSIPAEAAATEADQFDSSETNIVVLLQQGVAAIHAASEARDYAEEVDAALQGRLSYTGTHGADVHEQLDWGILLTDQAISALEMCF